MPSSSLLLLQVLGVRAADAAGALDVAGSLAISPSIFFAQCGDAKSLAAASVWRAVHGSLQLVSTSATAQPLCLANLAPHKPSGWGEPLQAVPCGKGTAQGWSLEDEELRFTGSTPARCIQPFGHTPWIGAAAARSRETPACLATCQSPAAGRESSAESGDLWFEVVTGLLCVISVRRLRLQGCLQQPGPARQARPNRVGRR